MAADLRPPLRRIGWFVLLWTLGVLSVAAVALIVRVVMNAAGLTA